MPRPSSSTWSGPSDDEVRRLAPAHPPVAVPEKKLDLTTCAQPFQESRAQVLQAPVWPAGAGRLKAHVIIKIALDATGRVADASVLLGSKSEVFDTSALAAAVNSEYSPRLFLCSPIPGFSTFRANFEPSH